MNHTRHPCELGVSFLILEQQILQQTVSSNYEKRFLIAFDRKSENSNDPGKRCLGNTSSVRTDRDPTTIRIQMTCFLSNFAELYQVILVMFLPSFFIYLNDFEVNTRPQ